MKKVIVKTMFSAIIIGILVWVTSFIFSFSYGEWSLFIGLGLSVVIFFFNSSGGTLSKVATHHASESVWKIQKDLIFLISSYSGTANTMINSS